MRGAARPGAGPAVAAGLAAALAALPAPASAADCCAPSLAVETTWSFSQTGAAITEAHADDLGGVYLGWEAPGGRLLSVSRDGGETWEGPVAGRIVPGERIAVAGDGTVLAARFDGSAILVRVSRDQARSFSPSEAVLDLGTPESLLGLRVAVRREGLAVVLATVRRVAPLPVVESWAVGSSDHGATWSPGVLLHSASSGQPVDHWGVALSATTALAVRPASDGVWAYRSADGGLAWGAGVRVDSGDSEPDGEQAVAATTDDGTFQVAFDALGPVWREHRVSVSPDDGVSWPGLETVVGEAGEGPLVLAALDDGSVVAGGWGTLSPDPLLQAIGSSDRGLPGTWAPAPVTFPEAGVRVHHVRAVAALSQVVFVHDDYRDDNPDCPDPDDQCESIYAQRSCDGGATWVELRIDDDTPPRPVHSEDPEIAFSRSGRLHVAWTEGLFDGDAYHAAFDLPEPPDPVIELRTATSDPCAPPGQELAVVAESISSCPSARFRWLEDGAPIPGATASTHRLPDDHEPGSFELTVVVSCGADPSCTGTPPGIRVDVQPPPVRPRVLVTELPATDCLPSHHQLDVDPELLAACPGGTVTWFVDDRPVPGVTGPSLVLSLATVTPGLHRVRYEVACPPSAGCASSAPVEVDVLPDAGSAPRSVGPALRVADHGDPHAGLATAVLSWAADLGAPRPDGDHFHVSRGTRPDALALLAQPHSPAPPVLAEATPAAEDLPLVHYYRVVAADACERESAD